MASLKLGGPQHNMCPAEVSLSQRVTLVQSNGRLHPSRAAETEKSEFSVALLFHDVVQRLE